MQSRRLYFDYAATTPVAPEVLRAMEPYWSGEFGNPGSLHSWGQAAMNAVDRARETLSGAIGASFREIVFAASATEANNLGVIGTLRKFRMDHSDVARPRVILSSIEHPSVLEAVRAAERERGAVEVVYAPVDAAGRVNVPELLSHVNADTALVFTMYGHNEIGTIQPVAEIAEGIQKLRSEGKTYARFHTDAVQAFPFLPCRVDELGVDLMTLSSQKIYGPKGAAALYVRGLSTPRSIPLEPLVRGGGQEYGLRAGTENVPAIVGFGAATELLLARREKDADHVRKLKNYCWERIREVLPGSEVNGPPPKDGLLHILNVYLPRHASEDMLTALDLAGIAVSAGSACSARSLEPSAVIEGLGHSRERAASSIRVSFGRPTTKEEVDVFIETVRQVLVG